MIASLGEPAGKIWRVGLLGYGTRPEGVDQALADQELTKFARGEDRGLIGDA